MGTVYRYTHGKCGFQYQYFEGVGFKLFAQSCDSRKHMRNGDWGEKWKALLEQHPDGTAVIDKRLCYCQQCKEYHTEPQKAFYVKKPDSDFEYGEDERVPLYKLDEHFELLEKEQVMCPKCDEELKVLDYVKRIECPVCGELVVWKKVGLWD